MDVSVLGFGSSEIGFSDIAEETVSRLLNEALDAGLNVIDTAECYGNAEELIGNTVSHRRDDFFLFTKCGHLDGFTGVDWSVAGILGFVERSLRCLKTDCVDLVMLHTCNEDVLRQGEAIEGLQQARERGYTRYIGYSGDSMAMKYAIECDAFDALETSVNIADQEAIELTLPLAVKRNLGVIVKRPVANVAWRTGKKPESEYNHAYWDRLVELDYDFLKGDLPGAVNQAIRFTMAAPGVHTLIVGTSKLGRWLENAAIVDSGPLPAAEHQAIRARWNDVAQETWIGQG
jgi:aryl-alcohol dehydrogenase-like predicted oxidoreductase